MKLRALRAVSVVAFASTFAVAPLSHATDSHLSACISHSTQSLDAVVSHNYAAATKYFSKDLKASITPKAVASAWSDVQRRHGAYRKHGEPHSRSIHGQHFVMIETWFADGPLNNVTSCNADGKINFSQWMFDAAGTIKSAKSRVLADGVRVFPLSVKSSVGLLPALLTLPAGKGPFPGVVMLVGSGPQDMNESVGPNKPFQDLALGLAKLGVATLRYDKRTHAYRLNAATNKDLTVDDVVTDDALTAVALLKAQKTIEHKHVFVLGHSLGAMVATRVGERDPQLAGLVLLGAPAVPVLEKAIRQVGNRASAATQPADKAKLSAAVTSLRKELSVVEKANPAHPPGGSFMGMPQSYWVTLHWVHPVENVKQLHMPALILQGDADQAVSPKYSFGRWTAAFAHSHRVTLKSYRGLNHAFLPAANASSANRAAPRQHVPSYVTQDIASWIKSQSAY